MRKPMPSGYGNRHFYGNINGNAMADEQESEDEEEELIEEEEEEENLQDDEHDYEDNVNANEGSYEDDEGLDGYSALPQQYHQGTSQEQQKSPSTSEEERLFFRPVKRSYRQVNSNGEDDNAEDINAGEENEENDFLENGQVPMAFEQSIEGRNTFSHSSRERPPKKKSMASLKLLSSGEGSSKKPKRKSNNVWNSRSSRKNSKKSKASTNNAAAVEDSALITPIHRLPDKVDDTPEMKICLSKFYKAERIELSEERLTAGSTKGYRMVRATRGVVEGAWYFEIKVVSLGETGHTRLGWCTDKGDIQAPVGYDGNSYGYRDVDGSKVHKAVREPYGDSPYVEGDVIGFYISLPDGGKYAPKPPQYVYYRGQPYSVNSGTDEVAKVVPGSEIIFFRNGVCQGVAFQDIFAGRYYPAASMYTLPNQPNCTVRFNFGPTFECYPEDFGSRPQPKAMHESPYCGIERKPQQQSDPIVENGHSPASKADNNDVNGQSSDSKAETKVANDQSSDSKADTKVANGESSVLVGEPDDTNGQSSEMQTENPAENGQLLGLEVEANDVNDQY